jgi:hypothetical protein
MPAPSDDPNVSSAALREHRSFLFYWLARTSTNGAYHMQAVAVGWQIYELTGSAFDLGLVGLVQFFPVVVLGIVVGQIADRYDRRVVVATCQVIKALAAAGFAFGTLGGWLGRDAMLAILFVSGSARAFETPTMHALVPGIVPPQLLPRAIAASATATQTAVICGPALGGFLYVLGAGTVYLTCTAVFVLASVLVGMIRLQGPPPEKKPVTVATLFAGFDYIWGNKVVLGAISLDLFAVLLGGATALLPVFARDILHVGAQGFGLLRTAPAVGATVVALYLAGRPIQRRAGAAMFGGVALFGLATIVFGLSRSFGLSLVALMTLGGADMVSVYVRQTLIQVVAPDAMRGRVAAVSFLFIGASNELGEFESGVTARLFGPVLAAVLGGVASLAVTVLWARLFPDLRRVDRLE